MGPWYIRNVDHPFRPGCSYETLRKLIESKRVGLETVLRGPTTGQFWMLARRVPGVAHLLGVCHSCQAPARPDEYACRSCGAVFEPERDRQHLGLGPIRPLPGQERAEMVAARLSVSVPEVPRPVPGGAQSAVTPAVGAAVRHVPTPVDSERLRRAERRSLALRRRLIVSLSANIVLACAVVVAVTMLAINGRNHAAALTAPPVRDPVYLGPALDQGESESASTISSEKGDEHTEFPADASSGETGLTELEVEDATGQPLPERDLDITLMSWTDAESYLIARVDENDAGSIRDGLKMLDAYEQANGLPEAGRQLREAWTYRLEQLGLQGLP